MYLVREKTEKEEKQGQKLVLSDALAVQSEGLLDLIGYQGPKSQGCFGIFGIVDIVDIVEIDDTLGIIDIVDTVEAIWNNTRLCSN